MENVPLQRKKIAYFIEQTQHWRIFDWPTISLIEVSRSVITWFAMTSNSWWLVNVGMMVKGLLGVSWSTWSRPFSSWARLIRRFVTVPHSLWKEKDSLHVCQLQMNKWGSTTFFPMRESAKKGGGRAWVEGHTAFSQESRAQTPLLIQASLAFSWC